MTAVPRRLFVALEPPPDAVAELDRAVAPVRAAHPRLRWTAPDSWHLTLAFLGDVDPETEAALRPALAGVASRHPAPRIALAGSGRFGERALWVGIETSRTPMRRLADDVRHTVRHAGVALDDRPWRGHLTIARSAGREGRLRDVGDALAEFRGLTWTATHLHLVHSNLGLGPARYRTVGRWRLPELPPR